MSSIKEDSQASFIHDEKSVEDFEKLISNNPGKMSDDMRMRLNLDLKGHGLSPGVFPSNYKF